MFSEILKIIPRIEGRDLSSMERTLNKRFQNVAKKFGSGLLSAIKGGGIVGLGVALIDKLLNPLKEVQDSIEKSLNTADQLNTNAGQFNTTSGKLARLQAFGKAKGLDPEQLNVLIQKFQSAVADAAKDPGTKTAVSAFVGKTDTAEAFFEFIQAMQKLNKTQQSLVQAEVFGEKQILKMSEFLQTDFSQAARMIGGPSAEQLTRSIDQTAKLEDVQAFLRQRRELKDLDTKGQRIQPSMIQNMNDAEEMALAQENKRLGSYDSLKQIQINTDKLLKKIEDAYLKLAPSIATILPVIVEQIGSAAKGIEKSRAVRGMVPGAGKDK